MIDNIVNDLRITNWQKSVSCAREKGRQHIYNYWQDDEDDDGDQYKFEKNDQIDGLSTHQISGFIVDII